MIGRTISHYRINAAVGSGAMGQVYSATDTKLGREVALKVLTAEMACDSDRLARFRHEARSVAALNHPHIVTLYSVEEAEDVHFLTMELVSGQSLDHCIPEDGLPIERIIEITRALAEALAAAHERGIVHRDLKPANVMVTDDHRVKVLDFGLAKDVSAEKHGSVTQNWVARTEPGTLMGTPAYMSPEQIAGRAVDHRTDIFSLGVMLHEMSTGSRPFHGRSPFELASAILRDTPPLVTDLRKDLPHDLAHITHRCLEKDPGYRFQTARDIVRELRDMAEDLRLAANAGPSIAVMPFQNLSGDAENEYFSEGLAEEILNALSQVEGLNVAARASSFYFKGKAAETNEIATRLRVGSLLQGSVRRSGNRLRVTVQLVDARNGFQLWSERYDRQMEDVFEIQDEIARAITERLKVTLGARTKRSTNNLEAYEMYLKGRHLWHQRLPNTLRAAIQCFEETIRIDPQYALAYAGLADCYGVLRFYGWMPAEVGRETARAAVAQAMKLEPSRWEVIFSRAIYTFYYERDWQAAEPDFLRAVTINPRSSLAQVYYALFLGTAGRSEESARHTALACELDPLSASIHGIAAGTLFALSEYEASERAAWHALELQPEYLFGLWTRGMALCGLRRNQEAIDSLERAVAISRAPIFVGILGFAYALSGRLEDANRLLRELEERGRGDEYIPASALLTISVGKGDLGEIREALTKAIAEGTTPLAIRLTCKFIEKFRSDPEINRLHSDLLGW